MAFLAYQSVPHTRLAHRLTQADLAAMVQDKKDKHKFTLKVEDKKIEFKAVNAIGIGDVIVKNGLGEYYHQQSETFRHRYGI